MRRIIFTLGLSAFFCVLVSFPYAETPIKYKFQQEISASGGVAANEVYTCLVEIGQESFDLPFAYQLDDGARLTTTDSKQVSAKVVAFNGCPFALGKLAVNKNVVLAKETVIDIESVKEDVFQSSKKSAVPFVVWHGVYICPQAVNVVWRFPQAGLSFEDDTSRYTVVTPGATVAFRENGVELQGIKQEAKKPAQ